jgi:hypothetical protein
VSKSICLAFLVLLGSRFSAVAQEPGNLKVGPEAGQRFESRLELKEVNFVPVPPPAGAPAVRLDQTRGRVDAGKHEYVVTFITETGETQAGPAATITTDGGHEVSISNIPVSSNSAVIARGLYRSKAREKGNLETDKYYLLTTIKNNTTTSYADAVADNNLGPAARLLQNNTTAGSFWKNRTKTGFIGETNTFLGLASGAVSIGSYNTAVGVRAIGSADGTGDFNAAVGYEAMLGNRSGYMNSCLGSQCLFLNATGWGNTAAGETSLKSNRAGSENVAVGWQALRDPENTSNNVAVGVNALRGAADSSGSGNVAVGPGALYAFKSGNGNVAAGLSAGANIATGDFNTALGHQALNQTNIGSRNIGVGVNAGNTNKTGSDNTIIGSFADVGSPDVSNAIAIGAKTIVTQSNSMVLGNKVDVGIGTSAPKARLEVAGGNLLVGTPGQGIILKSPDGATCRLLSIDNQGSLVTGPIRCP